MSELPGKMFEGVFSRVLADDLSPALKDELKAVGLDLTAPLLPSYAREVWHRAIDTTARALYPAEAPPEQLRRLGTHLVDALQSRGIIKGPVLAMARFAGPRRTLKQALEFLDRSPVQLTVVEKSKTEFEVTADTTEQPEFLVGLLTATITLLGGKSAEVQARSPGVFLASWK